MSAPATSDGAAAYTSADPVLNSISDVYPNSALDFPDPVSGLPMPTTTTMYQSVVHINELFKLFFAMKSLSRTSNPLANLYLRNRVDYHAVRLDTALWMDWEFERKAEINFKARLVLDGRIVNFDPSKDLTAADRNTVIGAYLHVLQQTPALAQWNIAGPNQIPEIIEFFKLLRDKLAKFFSDTERIETEYDRVNRYVTAYIDTQMDTADSEVGKGAAVIAADVKDAGGMNPFVLTSLPITTYGPEVVPAPAPPTEPDAPPPQ